MATREYKSCFKCIHYPVCKMRILVQTNNEHKTGTGDTTIWMETHYSIATVCLQFKSEGKGG